MTKGKLLAVCCIWLVILGIAAATWKMIVEPMVYPPQPPWYEHQITFALDSFSGYAVFRSQGFQDELTNKKIKLTLKDDGANYAQRIRALKKGEVQMAVFTVDALIKASAEIGDLPAVIVALVDETIGADAMVADRGVIPNVDALNGPATKFVLTRDSPSETLARVVKAHFQLDKLGENPFVAADGAEDVYDRYTRSPPDTHQVFVLWEPYVSKVLENPDMHVVVDSGDFEGYIVDVIVANENYFRKNQDTAGDFVEAYFNALDANSNRMVQLVYDDAEALGEPVDPAQAEKLVKGIWWKNTQENLAHMGLHGTEKLQHVEDIIRNITQLLKQTDGISRDPTGGQPNLLYNDTILTRLGHLHPAQKVRRPKGDLGRLTEVQVRRILQGGTKGTIRVPPLVFGRGTAKLTSQSCIVLDDLAQKLETWPQYYLVIRGDALRDDDPEVYRVNQELALERAEAARQYLIAHGIGENRVYAIGGEPSGSTLVSFVLGRPPR